MGSAKATQNGIMDGAPCHLECIPCGDDEGLQQFRGGEWVALKVDLEWVYLSRHGQITPMRPVTWAQPDNYGVPQFLEVLQNGQSITALGALGTPHLAIFVVQILPFPRGKPPKTSGPSKSAACDPGIRRRSSRKALFDHLRVMQPIWSSS